LGSGQRIFTAVCRIASKVNDHGFDDAGAVLRLIRSQTHSQNTQSIKGLYQSLGIVTQLANSILDPLIHCLVYIDLNMVRAGAVKHPSEWAHCGYSEIQKPRERYTIVDLPKLSGLCGFREVADFQQARRQWVSEALSREIGGRDERWSEAIAVGDFTFVDKVKSELGFKAMHRRVTEVTGTYTLREEK
jgi:hypothetical protein